MERESVHTVLAMERNITGSSGRINGVKLIVKRDHRLGFQIVAVGCIEGVATLTAFCFKKMYGRFAETKKWWP